MSKKKKLIIGFCVAALIIALIAAFFIWRNNRNTGGFDENAVYMQSISDLQSFGFTVDRYSGVVEAQKTQSFKRDPEKKIEEIYVTVGQEVKVGTPLFKYDVKDSENRIASINLDIEGLNNDIAVLRSAGSSTEIQLQISEKELEIRQKQAELENLKNDIEHAEVQSTLDGIVKIVTEETSGNNMTGEDLPVVAITEMGEFRIKGKVSEQTINNIFPGMEVIIRSRVDETQIWTGKISNIETEPANNSQEGGYFYSEGSGEKSSSYPFYVSMDSTDGLMLGQHVFIEPDYGQGGTQKKEGLWLDMSFVAYDENGTPFVWSAERGKTVKKYIELGEMDEDTYTVEIKNGLTDKDFITWPDESLTEGMNAISITEVME